MIKLAEWEAAVADNPILNRELQIGFDYGPSAVIRRSPQNSAIELVEMEWGFLPSYLNSRQQVAQFRNGYKKADGAWQQPIITLNAMSEELLKPGKIFRNAALERRCLIISSGFFDWRHEFPISKKTGKPLKTAIKYPYHVSVKNQDYFFMAGIWQPWSDKETGEYSETFSIITTQANALMAQVHNSKKRMPTILTADLALEWLSPTLHEERISELAKFQFPTNQMEAYSVAKDFRNAHDPAQPVVYEDLPELQL